MNAPYYTDNKTYFKRLIILIPAVSVFISLIYMIGYKESDTYYEVVGIISNIILTGGLWIGCTTIVNLLWKKYPWEQKPIKHLIIEVSAILIYTNTYLGLLVWFALENIYAGKIEFTRADIVENFIVVNMITFLITSIHEAVYFYLQWKEHFSKSAKLEKDNIQAKYETLKSQINPHFLFNSLNSLTNIVDENPKAVDYIDNLSEFLRYVLKSRDHELVLLRDEIVMLNKYISLQKSRFYENLLANINVDEKFYHYSLPPLVLQMLVENCVKHNIISTKAPLQINIYTKKNSIFIENNLQIRDNVTSTGHGLQNIKDRFAYFTTNEIKVSQTNQLFKVEIPLLLVEL